MKSKEALKNLVKELVRVKKKDLIKNGYNERVSSLDILSSKTIDEINIIAKDLEMLEELKKENNKLKAILYSKRPECIIDLENELSKRLGLEEKENDKRKDN